jgi:hypothetical protein
MRGDARTTLKDIDEQTRQDPKMKNRHSRSIALLVVALLGAGAAQAASSWSFTGGGSETGANAFGNTRSYAASSGGGNVAVSAWSDTRNNGANLNAYIESAYLGTYNGGLGVTNRDAGTAAGDASEGTIQNTSVPGHTMDNNSRYDSMLFDFGAGKSAQLKSVTVGWWYNDSDIMVLAYTGTGTPTFTSANQGYSNLLSSGWSMVKSGTAGAQANYLNAAGGAPAQSTNVAGYVPLAVNDLNISARYWLIGALNTIVQALPAGTSDASKDYVKIAAMSVSYGKVPEPSSIILAGSALAGVLALRRRKLA